ncbi:MAG: proline--tRNA ligase [Nitrospina sp.]|nr:proline--tRNA ligase [Nitrospina sp.]
MYYSKILIPTLKDSPADAEVTSHKLMVRAGMIRQVAAGIYSILPLGLRVLRKVEQIIREEMDQIGGQEVFLPSIQPAELWAESGRWDFYGKELLRFKDRNNREFCYGPTHEEVITDIVRCNIKSYRQLPITLYQIQTKFRDEVRPRFGIMRGREFTMKDAYSFHTTEESTRETYSNMANAYSQIFERCGLSFKMVEADSGTIGGNFSHEFVVLANSGEDSIGFCDSCDYASNIEKTEAKNPPEVSEPASLEDLMEVATPQKKTIEEVTQFLRVPQKKLIKTIIFETEQGLIAGLVRGDRGINPIKLKKLVNCEWLIPASEELITKTIGLPCGYLGPVGIKLNIFADKEVSLMFNSITGANKLDTHLTGVQFSRDLNVKKVGDIRNVNEGDSCVKCDSGKLKVKKGIEVGHIFILGKKYSESMQALYLDNQGKEKPMIMGCYGIGVGRTAAAAIEQNNDEKGIIWPVSLAPFQAVILPVNFSDNTIYSAAKKIYKTLWKLGVETLLDDRSDRLGAKFKDAELLGIPMQIVVGLKNLDEGKIEIKLRKSGDSLLISFPEEIKNIPKILSNL